MIITTTNIVSLCAKLAALSSNQANLGTSDFLNFANLAMGGLTAELLAAREEYLNTQDSIPVTAGTNNYRIPYRSINGEIRHLWFEDASGTRYRLYPRSLESIENYTTTATGTPDGFYIQGNFIYLTPIPNISGNLVVVYPFRPNQLVDATTTQTITAVNGNVVTVNNIPTNFTSGATYDVIDHQSGNGIVVFDQTGTISGNTITLTSAGNAAVGNYIALANQSPVPMIPEEGMPLLLELTVMRLEMTRGNAARIKNSAALIQDARKAWDLLLQDRVVSKAHPAGGQNPLMPSSWRPW